MTDIRVIDSCWHHLTYFVLCYDICTCVCECTSQNQRIFIHRYLRGDSPQILHCIFSLPCFSIKSMLRCFHTLCSALLTFSIVGSIQPSSKCSPSPSTPSQLRGLISMIHQCLRSSAVLSYSPQCPHMSIPRCQSI